MTLIICPASKSCFSLDFLNETCNQKSKLGKFFHSKLTDSFTIVSCKHTGDKDEDLVWLISFLRIQSAGKLGFRGYKLPIRVLYLAVGSDSYSFWNQNNSFWNHIRIREWYSIYAASWGIKMLVLPLIGICTYSITLKIF